MNVLTNLFKSSLGRKFIMGLTGLALFGFVIGHLAGNLLIFFGADSINAYGAFLKGTGKLLWGARIGLIVAVALHIWAGITLTMENREARPVPYANPEPPEAGFGSRYMAISGSVVLAFIIYHLLHFTFFTQWVNGAGVDFHDLADEQGRHDIYEMLVIGFRVPIVALFYLLAVGLLSVHLSHGVMAMFQSLGLRTQGWADVISRGAKLFAILIFVGYASIPLAVIFGFVGADIAR